ncbi:MAG: hypothetical protein JWO67_833 [Streptosporangiaceae bacterium]|nr:hypothetical protein [Streptosporangiaceae bacterium]
MPTPVLRADTEMVAIAWLLGCTGISNGMAASTLPKDNTSWSATGFVTVSTLVGAPNPYYPLRNPVLQVDCWATVPGSNKPPWGIANNLAETVVAATYGAAGRVVTLPAAGYPPARVLSAWVVTEPRRVYSDPADYARYMLHLGLTWAEVTV